MKKLSLFLFLICFVANPSANAQVDTSSFFPLGVWGVWVDRTNPPFGSANPTVISSWSTETSNWSSLNANYLVAWIPQWLEDTVMTLAQPLGYKMDIARSPWHQANQPDTSIESWIQNSRYYDWNYWTGQADNKINAVWSTFGSRSGFYSYYLAHEYDLSAYQNDTSAWLPLGYCIDKIKQVDPGHKSYVAMWGSRGNPPFPYGITLSEFSQRFKNLGIYQVDDYVFILPATPTKSSQQLQLDSLLMTYQDYMHVFMNTSTEWHAIIQAQRSYKNSLSNINAYRPNLFELRAQAYLALSRGARGITSFVYGSAQPTQPQPQPNQSFLNARIFLNSSDTEFFDGLVDVGRNAFTAVRDNDPGHIPAFDNLSSVYSEIKSLGPTIRKLRIYDAFPDTAIPSNNIANITNVTGNHIEIGVFKRVDQGTDSTVHFMLVNRVCNDQDGSVSAAQNVTVTISSSVSYGVMDVVTGDIWLIAPNQNLTVSLDPGKGRLFAKLSYQAALLALASQGKSTDNTATQCNNQRKLFSDPSTGRLHEVFGSGYQVYARYSNDNGATWSAATRLSDGTVYNWNPSITGRYNYFGWYYATYVYVVWEKSNGGSFDMVYSYSTNNGQSWSSPQVLGNNNLGGTSLPVILASRPGSYSFELRVVYRVGGQLMSAQTTTMAPAPGNWSFYSVPSTNSASTHPSLTYTNYGLYILVYDENSAIYSQNSSGNGWSTYRTNVSAGAYMVSGHSYPSVDVTSVSDEHVAWEGTYYGYRVLLENKNLSSYYNLISGSYTNYYGASVTGNAGDKATVAWYDNSNRIWYTYIMGGYSQGAIQIGSGGAYASLSTCNPQGGSAKAVWTGQVGSPYYPVQLASQTFQKTDAVVTSNDQRLVCVVDSATRSAYSFGIGPATIKGVSGNVYSISLSPIVEDETMLQSNPWTYLKTENFVFPKDADSLQIERIVNFSAATQTIGKPTLSIDLLSATDSVKLMALAVPAIGQLADTSAASIPARSAVGYLVSQYGGRSVFLRLNVSGTRIPTTAHASLINVFHVTTGNQLAKQDQTPMAATQVASGSNLLLGNYPNPFNPSTTIQYRVDAPGRVVLAVYDILGREVATLVDSQKEPGTYSVTFDASRLTSGIYFSRLNIDGKIAMQKMLLLK